MAMKTFDTLSQTMTHLQKQGYTYDFNLCSGHIECNALKLKLHPEDFDVDEMHRFEGLFVIDVYSIYIGNAKDKDQKAQENLQNHQYFSRNGNRHDIAIAHRGKCDHTEIDKLKKLYQK